MRALRRDINFISVPCEIRQKSDYRFVFGDDVATVRLLGSNNILKKNITYATPSTTIREVSETMREDDVGDGRQEQTSLWPLEGRRLSANKFHKPEAVWELKSVVSLLRIYQ